jgi:LmbE family N-acetylglucosaminyl deacetylase
MRVLAIGAHPDDVELGCGGTIAAHTEQGDSVTMLVMTDGELGRVGGMDRRFEQRRAADRLGAEVRWGGVPDGAVPEGLESVRIIESIINDVRPDVVYVHAPADSHQDHRATATAAIAAGRDIVSILQYQSPSTLHFSPFVFVDISLHLDAKLAALREHTSQVDRNARLEIDAVEAQCRYWGQQARTTFAEAFQPIRYVVPMNTMLRLDEHVPRARTKPAHN